MDLTEALDFVRARKQGVLATIRANGRPQLSNIMYVPGDEDMFRISVTDDRAKTKNLRRDPRASLYVLGDNFYQYVVIEAKAELTPVAADPHDATVDALVGVLQGRPSASTPTGTSTGPPWSPTSGWSSCCAPSAPTGWSHRADAPVVPRRPGYGQVVPTRLAWDLIPASMGAAADFAVVALGL